MNSFEEHHVYALGDDVERLMLQTQIEIGLITRLLQAVDFQPKDKVLDLASGAGDITIQIAQKVKSVVGIDITEEQVRAAKKLAESKNVANVKFIRGDAYHLPLPDNEFEKAWSRYAFEYLSNPLEALNEMVRVTKTGGQIAIHDFNGWTFRGLLEDMQQQLYSTVVKAGVNYQIGSQLEDLFKQAGLSDIRVIEFQHNVVDGPAPAGIVADWKSRLEKMELEQDFESSMISWIRDNNDPGKHMHTNSFLVIGTVAEKASI